MRHRSLLPLLALTVALAHAGAPAPGAPGVNLRWDECFGVGGVGGVRNAAFACNTNLGLRGLFASIEPSADLANVVGCAIVVDIATASPVLPAWWAFRNVATCRQNSLTIGQGTGPTLAECPPWNGLRAVAGGINAYQMGLRGPNTARILAHVAVLASTPVSLVAAQEYFVCALGIDHLNTVGDGSCAGCNVPTCIVLSSVDIVTRSPGPTQRLTGPTNLTDSDFVTWQGGGALGAGGAIGCPAATPTRQSTWGTVKSLYR